MGILEIRTTDTLATPASNIILLTLSQGENGILYLENPSLHAFHFNHETPYINILRKWSRFCISYNFERNEAQAAFNGIVTELKKDPETSPNYNGTWDAHMISKASANAEMVIIIGRYAFDKNPFIGYYANVNAWDRTMGSEELKTRTLCEEAVVDQGNLVNERSPWNLTGILVKEFNVTVNATKCSKENGMVNAFLPITQLTRADATDLCHKFGDGDWNGSIAGNFETRQAFDVYYEGLYANQKYLDQCSLYDNGRIKTWLPYKANEDKTNLVHELSKVMLMPNSEEKFYTDWYGGPQNNLEENQCLSAYFGLVPKYQNLVEDSCSSKKCTACEIQNSFQKTSIMKLNGLCKYSYFDKTYQIKYDPENIISFIGTEKSIISFDFDQKIWTIRDVTNPYVTAVSEAPFRSLVIGNYLWTITNDTECSKEVYSKYLSLTSCSNDQFTCNDGLCISIHQR